MKKTTLLITAVAVILVLLFLGRMYFSEADFNLENPSWNGVSGLSAKPLYDFSDLSGAGVSDTLLIMSPQQNYTAAESDKITTFMRNGGKVVVMDDFGQGNSLLRSINSPITFNTVPLCEYDNYYINHSFPIVKNFNPSRETLNVSQLVFNHPVSLNLSGDAYPLAMTANTAWLDVNGNSELDGNERMSTYTVAARADYGNGELLVVGDPDIFINSMVDQGDNKVFMSDVLTGNVWVDVSHGRGLTTAGAVYYALKYDVQAQIDVILLTFIFGIILAKRRDIIGWIRRLIVRGQGNQ